MKKSFFFILIFLILGASEMVAQRYNSAIGVRAGYGMGFTYKSYVKPKVAFEGILGVRWRGVGATALVERHHKFMGIPGVQWYYGGGMHAGYWNDVATDQALFSTRSKVILGIDGVIGMEYTFRDIPINVSLDWIPMINFLGGGVAGNVAGGGGLAIRYAF